MFNEAIYIVDKDRKILFFNKAAEEITGYKASEIVGKHCFNNILNHVDNAGTNLCINGCPLLESIKKNVVMDANVYLHHKKGYRLPVQVKSIPYLDGDTVTGAVEVFYLKRERTTLNSDFIVADNLSMIDSLTGLLNRNFLKYRVYDLIIKSGLSYALLFIDIDDFKQVNDTYGHLMGDEVLSIVSNTLLSNTSNLDYIVRFGGEEILIFVQVDNINQAVQKAENLKLLINSSEERSIKYRPKVTIGVTMFEKNEPLGQAIDRADKAMYKGKQNGKNQISAV